VRATQRGKSFGARPHVKLAQDRRDLIVHCAQRRLARDGDLRVRFPGEHRASDGSLGFRERVGKSDATKRKAQYREFVGTEAHTRDSQARRRQDHRRDEFRGIFGARHVRDEQTIARPRDLGTKRKKCLWTGDACQSHIRFRFVGAF